MAKRREEIEAEIERQKLQQEMKEKKRKAFLKKQNKIYCKIVWKELAEKNARSIYIYGFPTINILILKK